MAAPSAVGAWAWVAVEAESVVSGGVGQEPGRTTNQRMELRAILEAVRGSTDDLVVHTDSAYAIRVIGGEWRGIANVDLVEPLRLHNHRITFVKVKAHSGNKWNEYVDGLVKYTLHGPE